MASEIRVNKINSRTGVGTITLSPTGVDFTGITTAVTSTKSINLNTQFINGIANPEINKGSGDIIYIDNHPEITRNSRQKEDVKIILEF